MPPEILISGTPAEIDSALAAVPDRPAVFLLWAREGRPWLARTNLLRRRLVRLLGTRARPSRFVHLQNTVTRVEYQLTGSRLESQFLLWEWARLHLGSDYRREIRLKLPPYVKLILSNRFPRTQVTTHIGRSSSLYFGPFRNRSTAVLFESEFLDLFQLRRCQEDLDPDPAHRGCIYGEMGRCLRPCQMAVGDEEYRGEAERVAVFLGTNGKSLLDSAIKARDRLSGEMDFEGAAQMHQRLQRIEAVLGLRDELARDVERLHAIAITPSAEPGAVELGWLRGGYWQGFTRLEFSFEEGRAAPLDTRLRELAGAIGEKRCAPAERVEQLAIFSRWFYSSWRDGEILLADEWDKIPWRKLVNAVSRVASAQRTPHPSKGS
jgi:excinuclease ABC subunit C